MFSTIDIEQPGNEMRRIEVVLRELERLSQAVTLDDLARGSNAFTAEQIGFNLGLARNSVSKDLNQLWSVAHVTRTCSIPCLRSSSTSFSAAARCSFYIAGRRKHCWIAR